MILLTSFVRGSRWRRSGGGNDQDGKLHSVAADLTWADDGSDTRYTISHAANLIMTNGWWVTRTTLHGQTLASIEWSDGKSSLTWHRVEVSI